MSTVTYENWNLEPPLCPLRSHLYSLEPCGIGTPQVESLTGYIARMAEAHCVLTATLISQEFASLSKPSQGRSYLHDMSSRTEALNGTGRMAKNLVEMLEGLTLRNDLRFLTLLFWADVLPKRGLLRRTRAWCPACYHQWRTKGQAVYEPLLWTLQVVAICPDHQQHLVFQCPHCQRQLPLLAWQSRPG